MRLLKFLQPDTMDCGPASLHIILKYYGCDVPLKDLRELTFATRDGTSLLSLSEAAESLGFKTLGVKISWSQFCNDVPLPCIVHWNQDHFVVVYKIAVKRGKCFVYVSDPAAGLLKYSKEMFLKSWIEVSGESEDPDKGIALLLEPTGDFYEIKKRYMHRERKTLSLVNIFRYIKPHSKCLIGILATMLVAVMLNLLLPFITQSVVDKGVIPGNISVVEMMLLAQLMIVVGQLTNNIIKNRLMLHMTTRISISLISDFLSKLMRLPISFFDAKMTGDILQRVQDHDRIQEFLSDSFLGILMAILLVVIYGFILASYDFSVLIVFILGTILYVGWVLAFLKLRRKLDYMRFQEASGSQDSIVQLVGGIQDIKLNNCENYKRREWETIQEKLFQINIKGLTVTQIQQAGGTFIDQTKNIIISFLAAKSVISGEMTFGMMTALTYIIGQLNAPVSQFISFMRESQDAGMSMERLGEIHNREDEEPLDVVKIDRIPPDSDIEFKNVTFRYSGPHSPKVLDDVSFLVPHGKVTAIVGASGSGKTTMLKMMLGFYPPNTGIVTLGGLDLVKYSESAWRRQCGCVMQDGFIFSNTIAENIGFNEGSPDLARVRNAADVANISDWIESLPLGYNTKIGADGHCLSVGQKQRILIARAAYKNSPYLFFDEATNSLDANNEKVIIENLDRLFENKTVVTIAHRLSTVRNADNIIVLNSGRIVEQGTHDELTAKRGYYFELVHNQLELV